MDDVEGLKQAVDAQARALVIGDLALFAAYATPAALTRFYRARKIGRARRFELEELHAEGSAARSVVRFRGGAGYEVHTMWERTANGWKATALSVPMQPASGTWWRRMLGRATVGGSPEREDLS